MSETKFTPGPWKVTVSENGIDVGVDGLDGETITGWIEPYDAHLIAAAPELYEALEKAAEVFRAYQSHHEANRHTDKAERNKFYAEQIEAALTKARGEA